MSAQAVDVADWEAFLAAPPSDKLDFFRKEGRLYDCLFSQQLDRALIDRLCGLADHMRLVTKTRGGDDFLRGLLAHRRAMLYFSQPSTRTFLSHMSACHILGLKVMEIRDLKTSSEVKGESQDDTIRTFASYVDLIIMRHHGAGVAERAAWTLNRSDRPVPVINAGSGADQHPTQALLDVYSLKRYLGSVDGKHIVMVGDLKRGRTVRSLSYLMKNFKGVRLTFAAPEAFRMNPDILDFLRRHDIPFKETDSLDGALRDADAIYMTRIQDEHDKGGESAKVDYSPFHLSRARMALLPKNSVVLHPLPRREEIPAELDDDPRVVVFRQERNGMWIRAALIAHIFGLDDVILAKKP